MSVTDMVPRVVVDDPVLAADASSPVIFTSDSPEISSSAQADFLAELALHEDVATPLCVGLFGPPGSGKSSLLGATARAVEALGRAAREAGLATPFVGRVAIVPVTFGPGMDAAATLTAAVRDALARAHPNLAALDADPDPHATAEAARERLDGLRQRLDAERRKLDDLTSRQARLPETVLLDGSGSQVDAYARAHRGRIERGLRGFGFDGDRLLAFKELVRDRAEPGVGAGWLPAFWAYRGQTRLLIVAAGFFVLFWLLGLLIDNEAPLIGLLRDSNERFGPLADWLTAHASWLGAAREVAGLAGLVAVALNLIRGTRFLQPVAHGARLLRADLVTRRRDLDGLVAHQAKRTETIARDVETASAHATDAEGRLTRTGSMPRPMTGATTAADPSQRASAFFAAIGDVLAQPRGDLAEGDAPERLVVCLDGFERLPGREAAAALDASQRLLARPGIVTITALDRAHVAAGFSDTDPAFAAASLDRIVQVPLDTTVGVAALTRTLLAPPSRSGEPARSTPEAARSAFEKPWLPKEAAVLEALAPFVGDTPRAAKRFVNLYRIARADPAMVSATPADFTALAYTLAMQAQGMLVEPDDGVQPDAPAGAARLAAAAAAGFPFNLGQGRRGLATAKRYVAR